MIMGAGMGAWFKKNYDRIIAAAVLLILLVSLVSLAIQAKIQKTEQRNFDMQLTVLKPRYAKVMPADKAVFEKALVALADPSQNEIWELSLLTPELRVKCVNCDRPIPYSSTNCTFSQCGAPQPESLGGIIDKNKNSIPDEWEEKYGLMSFDPDVINQDPDNDGFASKEEFEGKTDPKAPSSHPSYLAKLRIVEIKPIPFRMIFKAVSKANSVQIFQINLRTNGRTYWKKMGEDAEGFTLTNFDEGATDGPTLTLVRNGKTIPLIKGRTVPRDEYELKLVSLIDATEMAVRPDVDFEYKGYKYKVKKVDIQRSSVLINDPSRNVDIWVDRHSSESLPEAKK
jgi:hypothetical protein